MIINNRSDNTIIVIIHINSTNQNNCNNDGNDDDNNDGNNNGDDVDENNTDDNDSHNGKTNNSNNDYTARCARRATLVRNCLSREMTARPRHRYRSMLQLEQVRWPCQSLDMRTIWNQIVHEISFEKRTQSKDFPNKMFPSHSIV